MRGHFSHVFNRLLAMLALPLGALALSGCGSSSGASSHGAGTDAGGGKNDADDNGVRPLGPLTRLAVGYSGACIIDANDRVACWGQNPAGETGVPPNFTSKLRLVDGVTAVTDVVMGNTHTCALTVAGEVYCWGSNVNNQLGHVAGSNGDMTCAPPPPSQTTPCSWTPVKVSGLPRVLSISASIGFDSVCALVEGGGVYCWGETMSEDAAITAPCAGSKLARCFTAPTRLENVSGLTDLANGGQHACGHTSSGLVCWGNNSWHEVSSAECPGGMCATPVSRAELGTLAGPPGLGVNTTCLRKQNGDIACFGRNDYAQLAHLPGTSGDTKCQLGACNAAPTLIPGLAGARAISPTSEWSWCAIAKDGAVLCWGSNGTAELGHPRGSQGDTSCNSVTSIICNATPSTVPGVTGATAVAVGHWAACAIAGDGALWCWGGFDEIEPTRIGP